MRRYPRVLNLITMTATHHPVAIYKQLQYCTVLRSRTRRALLSKSISTETNRHYLLVHGPPSSIPPTPVDACLLDVHGLYINSRLQDSAVTFATWDIWLLRTCLRESKTQNSTLNLFTRLHSNSFTRSDQLKLSIRYIKR